MCKVDGIKHSIFCLKCYKLSQIIFVSIKNLTAGQNSINNFTLANVRIVYEPSTANSEMWRQIELKMSQVGFQPYNQKSVSVTDMKCVSLL